MLVGLEVYDVLGCLVVWFIDWLGVIVGVFNIGMSVGFVSVLGLVCGLLFYVI